MNSYDLSSYDKIHEIEKGSRLRIEVTWWLTRLTLNLSGTKFVTNRDDLVTLTHACCINCKLISSQLLIAETVDADLIKNEIGNPDDTDT